ASRSADLVGLRSSHPSSPEDRIVHSQNREACVSHLLSNAGHEVEPLLSRQHFRNLCCHIEEVQHFITTRHRSNCSSPSSHADLSCTHKELRRIVQVLISWAARENLIQIPTHSSYNYRSCHPGAKLLTIHTLILLLKLLSRIGNELSLSSGRFCSGLSLALHEAEDANR